MDHAKRDRSLISLSLYLNLTTLKFNNLFYPKFISDTVQWLVTAKEHEDKFILDTVQWFVNAKEHEDTFILDAVQWLVRNMRLNNGVRAWKELDWWGMLHIVHRVGLQ